MTLLPPHPSWFDLRVFYARISPCLLSKAPLFLLVSFPRRQISTELEVNGRRIAPSQVPRLTLRRDRLDTESAEATYVSTDYIRAAGDVRFEIHDREEMLVCGVLERLQKLAGESWDEGHGSSMAEERWRMSCECAISSPRSFLRGRASLPSMEVYVAGRISGLPIVLSQTVQLTPRRNPMHQAALHAIPEDEAFQSDPALAEQIAEGKVHLKVVKQQQPSHGCLPTEVYACDGGYVEGEEGDVLWFKAGLRVGVGIGLGMCLGIGIGVGLLIRTYQTTTWRFRRRK